MQHSRTSNMPSKSSTNLVNEATTSIYMTGTENFQSVDDHEEVVMTKENPPQFIINSHESGDDEAVLDDDISGKENTAPSDQSSSDCNALCYIQVYCSCLIDIFFFLGGEKSDASYDTPVGLYSRKHPPWRAKQINFSTGGNKDDASSDRPVVQSERNHQAKQNKSTSELKGDASSGSRPGVLSDHKLETQMRSSSDGHSPCKHIINETTCNQLCN